MTFELGDVIPGAILVAAIVATIAVVAFDRYRTRSLDLLRGRVTDLDDALNKEREERRREQSRCEERVSRVEGRLEAVTGPFAKEIVDAVREEVRRHGAS